MAKTKIKYVGRDDHSGLEFIYTLPGFAPVRGGDPVAAAKHFFSEMARKLDNGGRYERVEIDHDAYTASFASGMRGHSYCKADLVAGDARSTARIDITFIDISDESRLLQPPPGFKPLSDEAIAIFVAGRQAAAA